MRKKSCTSFLITVCIVTTLRNASGNSFTIENNSPLPTNSIINTETSTKPQDIEFSTNARQFKYPQYGWELNDRFNSFERFIKKFKSEEIVPTWPSRGKREDKIRENDMKRKESSESEPFWGSRGRRNDEKNIFWGSRGRRKDPYIDSDIDELLAEVDSPQVYFLLKREDPFWGMRGKKDEPFWGSRGKKDEPFWGSRGKKDEPFWGSRGKRDEPFWGSRGKKEEPFWGSRGKKDHHLLGMREQREDPFWGMRGKREDPFWGMRGKKDNDDELFWGMRGKKNYIDVHDKKEDPFWGMRGKKSNDFDSGWNKMNSLVEHLLNSHKLSNACELLQFELYPEDGLKKITSDCARKSFLKGTLNSASSEGNMKNSKAMQTMKNKSSGNYNDDKARQFLYSLQDLSDTDSSIETLD